jgi:predicted RND superfamily exporter protein
LIRIFRYEWIIWLALVGLLALACWQIPKLRLEFSFRDSYAPGHPTRDAYETYEKTFGLGPGILVILTGPDLFKPKMLATVETLANTLRRLPGTQEVASPLDIREPNQREGRIFTTRPLGPRSFDNPTALAHVLQDESFRQRWKGFLLDADLATFQLLIRPQVSDGNPRTNEAYLTRVEELLKMYLDSLDLEIHLSGIFFVNQEILRTTSRDQGVLMIASSLLQAVLIISLFASFGAALMVFGLINVAIVLAFLVMALCDLPINFMSGNLPIMVGVIGLADLIHILGAFARARRLYSPRGSAIRALRRTALPNFLTTITTVGCILVTTSSPLKILETFSLSLSLGVILVYLVTIIYAPLLLQRSSIHPGRGLFFLLQAGIQKKILKFWLPLATHRVMARSWGVFIVLCLMGVASQSINSNWFRNFSEDHPVTRSLDFLHSQNKPVSSVQYTLETHRCIDEILTDKVLEKEIQKLNGALTHLPNVCGVYSLLSFKNALDRKWQTLTWPKSLDPHWIATRRQATYRQYLSGGAFDNYYNGLTQELRFVVTTSLEDSQSFARLQESICRTVKELSPRTFEAKSFRPRGHMLYWTEIVNSISSSYFRTLLGSLLVIFFCFLIVTHSLSHALLALIPNILPLLAMFASARLFGYHLNENFCSMAALSIGIAVDDSLHLLHHYRRAYHQGITPSASLERAFTVCGAPVLLTSVCLILGFSLCLQASLLPLRQTGLFLTFSVFVALLADLSLMPLLLLHMDQTPPRGEQRQYSIRVSGNLPQRRLRTLHSH